jgi:tetratricopeptide (TPR) repeat protein
MWEKSAEVASDQAMPHFILGHKYLNASNLDKAIEELEQFNEINPYNLIAISNLASAHLIAYETQYIYDRAHADRAHVDRAIALCQQGLTMSENSALLWDTLGHAYTYETSLKNLDRAMAFFERGLKVQPENAMLNFHMGATLVKQQKFDYALQCLERARQQAEIPDIYKFMAMSYQGKGRFQEAINNYNEYLKRLPNAADAATISQQLKDLRAQLNTAAPQS